MDMIPKIVRDKVRRIFQEHDLPQDPDKFIDKLALTDIPKDDHWTRVYHERAIYEARDIPENYYCFVCGKKYDHPDEFTECLNDHFVKFQAGIPIERTSEHIDLLVGNLHPNHRKEARDILTNNKQPGFNPQNPKKEE